MVNTETARSRAPHLRRIRKKVMPAVSGLGRLLTVWAIILSQLLGAVGSIVASPATAMAADTLTGTCYAYATYVVPGEPIYGAAKMPDGKTISISCYQRETGVSGHEEYYWPADGNYSYTAYKQPNGGYYVIIDCWGAAPYPGAAVGSMGPQQLCGMWYPQVDGWLSIAKMSSNEDLTVGNDTYNLEGAWFHVYKDGSDWSQAGLEAKSVGWMVTKYQHDEYGHTIAKAYNYDNQSEDWLTLPEGTYWVREEWANNGEGMPTGYELGELSDSQYEGYKCGPWVKVEITADKTTWADNDPSDAYDGYWVEKPVNDPANIVVGKKDAETTKGVLQGGGTFEGAEFTVKYFDNTSGTTTGTPERTWVLKTDANGRALLRDSHKVSGDDFYTNEFGTPCLPLGTYAIQETKAPEGYLVNDEVFTKILKTNNDGVIIEVFSEADPLLIDETVSRGGVSIQKIDDDNNSNAAQGDATLEGARFEIVNLNPNPVVVDERTYASGEVCLVLTTGDDGKAVSAKDALPYGTYSAREAAPSKGYQLNSSWEETFMIKDAGKIVELAKPTSGVHEDVELGSAKFRKIDAARDEAVPQGDATLKGAEISIYNASAAPVWVMGKKYDSVSASSTRAQLLAAAPVMKVYTDENGLAATPEACLPYGRYVAIETAPSKGYKINEQWREDFQIRKMDDVAEPDELTQFVQTGGVTVTKRDKDSLTIEAQGDATLKGAVIGIKNMSAEKVRVNGAWYERTEEVMEIKTTEDSVAFTATDVLPYGTYELYEKTPPEGYLPNTGWKVTVKITEDGVRFDAGNLDDDVKRGGYEVVKLDSDSLTVRPQGDATLAGAVLGVKNVSAAKVYVSGKWYNPGQEVMTVTTTAEAVALAAGRMLPYGTYEIYEKTPPAGYLPNTEWKVSFQIRDDGASVKIEDSLVDKVIRGGVSIAKIDSERDNNVAQGDATLAGAVVNIYNVSAESVYVNGEWVAPAAGTSREELLKSTPALTLVTDVEGKAASASDALPYGRYVAIEIEPSRGYLLNEEWLQNFAVSENGVVYELEALAQKIVRGDVVLAKTDAETGGHLPLGEGKLDGVEFTITNISDGEGDDGIRYENKTEVAKGETITITTDERGIARTEGGALPFGTYAYEETKNPYGYMKFPGGSGTFEIREDGVVVNGATNEPAEVDETGYPVDFKAVDSAAANQVIRGEMHFNKVVLSSQRELTGIPFKLTAQATGESHIIVTDANGLFDSADFDEGARTNANDEAVDALFAGDHAENQKIIGYEVDESKLDPEAGVWFAGRTDIDNPVDEGLASLPVGTYVLEELPCSANEGLTLVRRTITVKANERNNGKNYDIGTINDLDEPAIGTKLATIDGAKTVSATGKVKLVDTVSYENLTRGEEYLVTGSIVAVDSAGEVIFTYAGGEHEFTAKASEGSCEVAFEVDMDALEGVAKLVCFEYLFDGENSLVAKHEDLSDTDQTVTVVEIGTTLTGEEGEKEVLATTPMKLVDTISYKGLTPGRTYTATGELYDKATGESLGVTGKAEFTPEKAAGTAEVVFEIEDASIVAGKSVVAFEEVFDGKVLVGVHADLEDPDQTVDVPKIGTTLTDDEGAKVIEAKVVNLVDTVAYENLTPGADYTATGELHLTDGKSDLGIIEGSAKEINFTASDEGAGTFEMGFELDASKLDGKSVVAFERVWTAKPGAESGGDKLVAEHADPADPGQTVKINQPDIQTTLADAQGNKTVAPEETFTLVDTIAYTNLPASAKLTAKGELHQFGEDGEDLGVISKAEIEFETSDSGKGTVEVSFIVRAADLKSDRIVAYEAVGRTDFMGILFTTIATHEDPNDPGQTVTVKPEIGTVLADDEGNKEIKASETVKLVDTVSYKGLEAGRTYTATGELYDKATGESLGVTAEAEFVPESSAGTVEVVFEAAGELLAGKTVVAFERVSRGEREIAVHADIEDAAQTVTVPKIGTTLANVDGTKAVKALAKVTLVDTVSYENLIPGVEYEMTGTLMDKATSKPIAPAETVKFTPAKSSGEVKVAFTVDGKVLAGKTVVAFESLTRDGREVAVHADIDDAAQTVTVPKIGTTLTNKADGSHKAPATGTVTLVDTISYEGLTPGSKVTFQGELMDKATKQTTGIKSEVQITVSETGSGTAQVEFTVDATKFRGKSVVAFETAIDASGQTIAEHKDIEDAGQTVAFGGVTITPNSPKNVTTTTRRATGTVDTGDAAMIIAAVAAGVAGAAGLAIKATAPAKRRGKRN